MPWRHSQRAPDGSCERFGLHRAIPALKAAADGTVSADDFVKSFQLNGGVKALRAMAELLKKEGSRILRSGRARRSAQICAQDSGECRRR